MKIHYLTTSLEGGGAEAAIPRIVGIMRERGHEVEVIACEPRNMRAAPMLADAGIAHHMLFPERRGTLATINAFARRARVSRPDLIWTSLSFVGLVGAATGALLRIPVVSWKNCANRRRHTRLLRNASRLWVADSGSVARFLVDRAGIASDKVMTWPLFQPPVFTSWPVPWDGQAPLQIGSAGRLHAQKNYDLLIEAIAALRTMHPELAGRVRVTIMGEGPERERLRGLIAQHGLQSVVTLGGFVDDVPAFLQTLHLYVQPSRYEGMCLAAHEAMAAGLPVLATRVGELAQSIRAGGGGRLLDDDIVHSLATQIATLAQHPRELTELGQAGKAYVARTYAAAAFADAGHAVVCRAEALAGGGGGRTLQ